MAADCLHLKNPTDDLNTKSSFVVVRQINERGKKGSSWVSWGICTFFMLFVPSHWLGTLQAKRTRRCFENKTHNSLSIQKRLETITLIHIFYTPLSNDQASWEQPLLSNWPFNNGFDGFHLLEETGQKEMVPPGNFVSHSFLPAQTTATLRGRLIRQ